MSQAYYYQKLTLDDIWVDVDFQDRSFGRDAGSVNTLASNELIESPPEQKLLVIGADDSGKTSLAKYLYARNVDAGFFPLLLHGAALTGASRDEVNRSINNAITEQYGVNSVQRYLQKASATKILIIDDFDETPLNIRGQNEVLNLFQDQFAGVILTVGDLFPIERLSETGDERRPLVEYSIIEIQEMGHRRRGDLIERWLTLGREYTTADDDLIYDIAQTENNINTLLGKGLFPAYPMFVLAVLQTMEASSTLNTAELGTYGHVYDALIAGKLAVHLRGVSVDTKYTFLAELAFRVSDSENLVISSSDFDDVVDVYFVKYKIRIPLDDVLNEMTLAGILYRSGGDVGFKYKYVLYYFVAKYYALNLLDKNAREMLRARIRGLVANSHSEHAANVLLFLLYLTKDPEVIEEMLRKVKSVFEAREPVRFDDDVTFLGDLASSQPRLELPASSPREHLRQQQKDRDSRGAQDERADDAAEQYELLQLNAAMKSIQILGQILRNFPGSLPGSTKAAVAKEVYAVGLRSISAVFANFSEQLPELRRDIARFLTERRNIPTDRLERKTDQFLYQLSVLFGYAILKRISFALGSQHLTETYKEVLGETSTTSVAFVDMAIKLDHFRTLPVTELQELAADVRKSVFATSVLRRLVWDRLYFFPVEYKTKQKLCDLFDIYLSPQFHNKERKRKLLV